MIKKMRKKSKTVVLALPQVTQSYACMVNTARTSQTFECMAIMEKLLRKRTWLICFYSLKTDSLLVTQIKTVMIQRSLNIGKE